MAGRGGDEQAVFQVVEAIFVAVLVASALIFFALVQKPTPSPQGAGLDLARVAGDALGILTGNASTTKTEFEQAVGALLIDDVDPATPTAAQRLAVRQDLATTLPDGLRFLLRASVQKPAGTETQVVYGPTTISACDSDPGQCPEPRNAQGAVAYLLDDDAVGAPGSAQEVVLVELVVWNAF